MAAAASLNPEKPLHCRAQFMIEIEVQYLPERVETCYQPKSSLNKVNKNKMEILRQRLLPAPKERVLNEVCGRC